MDSIDWTPIVLETRDGLSQAAERGEISVCEDRTESKGEIWLRFVRIRAENPTGPPVIFLSGGPGDSGIQWASHRPFLEVFQQVAQGADLILLDQRGSGQSEPNLSVRSPALERDDLASEESMLALVARHLGGRSAPLHAYNVVESAADLMDLRAMLGVEKVSLWGYSYGTHLAQMTTKLHPDGVDRVVLCGFEGPDQTFKLPSNMDAQLTRLDGKYPGLLYDLSRALDRLAEPIEVDGKLFGKFALQHLCASWCGISNRYGRLPAICRSLAEGHTDEMARNMKDYLRLWARPLVFYSTDAASGATPGRWERIHAEAPASLLGNAANFPFPSVGEVLCAADMGDALRTPVESDLPFFVVTGSMDGFTPTSNAIESLPFLPNASHVEIEGAAHNDLISDPAVNAQIAAFLARLSA